MLRRPPLVVTALFSDYYFSIVVVVSILGSALANSTGKADVVGDVQDGLLARILELRLQNLTPNVWLAVSVVELLSIRVVAWNWQEHFRGLVVVLLLELGWDVMLRLDHLTHILMGVLGLVLLVFLLGLVELFILFLDAFKVLVSGDDGPG